MWIKLDEFKLLNTDSGCLVYCEFNHYHESMDYIQQFLYFENSMSQKIVLSMYGMELREFNSEIKDYKDRNEEELEKDRESCIKKIIDKFNELKIKLGVIDD